MTDYDAILDRMQELQFLARIGRIDRGDAVPTRLGFWASFDVDGHDFDNNRPKVQKRHAPARQARTYPAVVPDDEFVLDNIAPVPPKPDVPAQVVMNQHLIHRLDEMQAEVRRLERRVERLEGRQSIDDVHDGPWNWAETPTPPQRAKA